MILSAFVFILITVWLGAAIGTDDLFWFLPIFREKAAFVDLYWDGQQDRLLPGDPSYDLLHEALFAELPHVESHPPGVGLSDASLTARRQEGRLLELHYNEPVRIHSRYRFSASAVYWIPLSGHHVQENRVFNGARGSPLELKSMEQIRTVAGAIAQQRGLSSPPVPH